MSLTLVILDAAVAVGGTPPPKGGGGGGWSGGTPPVIVRVPIVPAVGQPGGGYVPPVWGGPPNGFGAPPIVTTLVPRLVPEPGTLLLFVAALVGMLGLLTRSSRRR